ncbi:MAG: TIM barrel protein [Albidovulum sp.]|nr:TIM barrel protein [Albidovulum sp.]
MSANTVAFGLNHMVAPKSSFRELIELAATLGCEGVEFRNDLPGRELFEGEPARNVRTAARSAGIRVLALAEVKRFNDGNRQRAAQADELIELAVECGAEAVSLIPVNDSNYRPGQGERIERLRDFLAELAPNIRAAGILGYVEPLGFSISSLRTKNEALSAIHDAGVSDEYRLIHDTFHHALAAESDFFAAETGLVHISGVDDQTLGISEMEDGHRALVGPKDQIGNIRQITELRASGYRGLLSFEPFASSVHDDSMLSDSLEASIQFVRKAVSEATGERA